MRLIRHTSFSFLVVRLVEPIVYGWFRDWADLLQLQHLFVPLRLRRSMTFVHSAPHCSLPSTPWRLIDVESMYGDERYEEENLFPLCLWSRLLRWRHRRVTLDSRDHNSSVLSQLWKLISLLIIESWYTQQIFWTSSMHVNCFDESILLTYIHTLITL